MQKLRERLSRLRDDFDLSQSNVAKIIQTSQQQYSKYEKGESELPVRAVAALARYYRVSADYLLGLTDYKEDNNASNQIITPGKTAGAVISDLLALSPAGRAAVLEQIALHTLKESIKRQ